MRRKAVYIELKNLVLLVLILVVVAAILLKVPGLSERVFGFFEKFGTVVIEGKALHVRIDPKANFVEVFEFHLTDLEDGQHISEKGSSVFYLNEKENTFASNCVILTTDEEPRTVVTGVYYDQGYVYYVPPGTTIQEDKECTSLATCIGEPIESGCKYANSNFVGDKAPVGKDKCKCEQKDGKDKFFDCPNLFGYVININLNLLGVTVVPAQCPPYSDENKIYCDSKQDVLNAPFRDFQNTKTQNECYDNPSVCNLLLTQKTDDKTHSYAYQVKYGLICDDDGKWKACTETRIEKGDKATAQGKKITCNDMDGVFIWDVSELTPPTTTPLPKKIRIEPGYSNSIFDKTSVGVDETIAVGGWFKTADDKPIGGKTLTLMVKEGGEWKKVIDLNPTQKEGDQYPGFGSISWKPDIKYGGEKQYYLAFYGDDLYEPVGSSVYTLEVTIQDPKMICDMTFEKDGESKTADKWCTGGFWGNAFCTNRVCSAESYDFYLGSKQYHFGCKCSGVARMCNCDPDTAWSKDIS